ncbi:MAG: class I SAM-dependent methyltransferase [Bdellovibrionota bacterium]
MKFSYSLKTITESIGARSLQIQCLEDLNQTIDALFLELEKTGQASLLEELCPYFGVIWPSARALALEIDRLPEREIRARSLLEVGCGLALPSLLAGLRGAEVTASDFHPEVPEFLTRNQRLNEIQKLRYVHSDWQNSGQISERFDWVIGSDILYERQHPPIVARAIAERLAPGGRAIVTDPGRPYLQQFVTEMEERGFSTQLRTERVKDSPVDKDIFILEFSQESRQG